MKLVNLSFYIFCVLNIIAGIAFFFTKLFFIGFLTLAFENFNITLDSIILGYNLVLFPLNCFASPVASFIIFKFFDCKKIGFVLSLMPTIHFVLGLYAIQWLKNNPGY